MFDGGADKFVLCFFHEWMNEKHWQESVQWLTKRELTYQKNFNCYQVTASIKVACASNRLEMESSFRRKNNTTSRKSFQLSEILDEIVGVSRSEQSSMKQNTQFFIAFEWCAGFNDNSGEITKTASTAAENEISFASTSQCSFRACWGSREMVMDVRVERRWPRRAILYQ